MGGEFAEWGLRPRRGQHVTEARVQTEAEDNGRIRPQAKEISIVLVYRWNSSIYTSIWGQLFVVHLTFYFNSFMTQCCL